MPIINTSYSENSPVTKERRIFDTLKSGRSLNRFEAEQLGDHCLNSTVSTLRKRGVLIVGQWESVPSRFAKFVRVLRYRYAGVDRG
jgi:hypothetical protein